MKQQIFLAFAILALFFVSCQHTEKEYYPNGMLRSTIECKGDVPNGVSTYYNDDGVKTLEVNYKNGKKEGRLRSFFFNGNLQTEEHYKNDQLNGLQTTYDLTGIKLTEIEYVDGVMNGSYREWHDKDVLKSVGSYADGLWNGHWEYYDFRGFLVAEGDFDHGTGDQLNYTDTGVLYKKSHYVNNEKSGEEFFYNSDGDVVKTIVYEKGRMVSIDGKHV